MFLNSTGRRRLFVRRIRKSRSRVLPPGSNSPEGRGRDQIANVGVQTFMKGNWRSRRDSNPRYGFRAV